MYKHSHTFTTRMTFYSMCYCCVVSLTLFDRVRVLGTRCYHEGILPDRLVVHQSDQTYFNTNFSNSF